MENAKQFWHDTCQRIQAIENFQLIMPELRQFQATHQGKETCFFSDPIPLLMEHPDFQALSNGTKSFLHIVGSLVLIDPRITCHVGMNAVQLPDIANRIILAEKRKELEDQDIDVPVGLKVQPMYGRYEFILVTGDPECVPLINKLYHIWKVMMVSGELQMSDDWIVVKFRPPLPARIAASRAPLVFRGEIVPPAVLKYIVQTTIENQPAGPNNLVECVIWVHTEYINGRINTQDDIDQFKLTVLAYIDSKIGDYKSFMWIRNISIVPSALWGQVSPNFPDHYHLKNWNQSTFTADLNAIIPPSKKCRLCNLYEENTTIIPLLRPYKCMPAGDYCQYCFSLYSRVVEKDL